MAWLLLLGAGTVESVMAAALSQCNRRPGRLAFHLPAPQTLKNLPTGTAYAVWTGIGASGIGVLGIVADGDSASPMRLRCLAVIATGIMALRLLET